MKVSQVVYLVAAAAALVSFIFFPIITIIGFDFSGIDMVDGLNKLKKLMGTQALVSTILCAIIPVIAIALFKSKAIVRSLLGILMIGALAFTYSQISKVHLDWGAYVYIAAATACIISPFVIKK